MKRFLKRFLLILLATTLILATTGFLIGCCVFSAPGYRGPTSDHFDGEKFHNPSRREHAAGFDFLRWRLSREQGPWRAFVPDAPGPPPPRRVGPGELRITFINHATTLVQMDGMNILTDPIWSERASPVSFAGPKRHRPPGIRFEDLPPIDAVVVSHNHYDHMDVPTLRRLAREHKPRIFVGLGNGLLLAEEDIPGGHEMDWWDSLPIAPDVTVTSVPAEHFSRRGLCDADETLWTGYVIRGPAGAVYFAGDTAYGAHFAEIRRRLGPVRLAILPIGAYRPRWFMSSVHVDPAEALAAHADLEARTSVAIHFGTFALADDGEREPVEELDRLRGSARFWVLEHGEGRDVPP